jgi:tetratricopeptide (TPR) repeat protein
MLVGIVALVAVLSSPPSEGAPDRMQSARRLHDAGDYAGAISIYQELLKETPDDPAVAYELMFSTYLKGDHAEARRLGEQALKKKEKPLAGVYIILGSAYDAIGEHDKAEKTFRRGLERHPDVPLLHFNLGVNLLVKEKPDKAASSFMEMLRHRPQHANSWLYLANSERMIGQPGYALAAYARFLTLEPQSARSAGVARAIWDILFAGVSRGPDKDGKAQINVTLPFAAGAEGGGQGMMLALVAASRHLEENEKKSDAQYFPEALATAFAILGDTEAKKNKDDEFWRTCAWPFFAGATEAKHLEAMAYEMRRSLEEPEVVSWLKEHAEAVTAYRAWLQDWKAPECGPRSN